MTIIEPINEQQIKSTNSRVFLIAQPSVAKNGTFPDLTPLAEYGDIRVVIEQGDYPAFKPGEALFRVQQRLSDFDPDIDYVAWAGGDTLAAVLVGAVMVQLGHVLFKWLRFERRQLPGGKRHPKDGFYTPVEIVL